MEGEVDFNNDNFQDQQQDFGIDGIANRIIMYRGRALDRRQQGRLLVQRSQ